MKMPKKTTKKPKTNAPVLPKRQKTKEAPPPSDRLLSDRLLEESESDPELVEFCERIRVRRWDERMTLEELAKRSNLSQNYIGTVESGRRDPSLTTLVRLANGFNVALADLFGPSLELSPGAIAMGKLFQETPEQFQRGLLEFLRLARKDAKKQ